jgi:phosphoglycerol transferase MdoB-like AlkP superfamily enzyme
MSFQSLLPNKYKKPGWFILIPTTIIGVFLLITDTDNVQLNTTVFAIFSDQLLEGNKFFSFIHTDITATIVAIFFIIGALLVGFSKEKTEDEFISRLRLSSLLWAVLVNYILLLLCFLFIYGVSFLNVMIYNMFTVLIIFIARFNYVLYRGNKFLSDEKHD